MVTQPTTIVNTSSCHLIVRIDSYEGEDTFLRCGSATQDHLFAVIRIEENGAATLVDNGYRTHDEARVAWASVQPG